MIFPIGELLGKNIQGYHYVSSGGASLTVNIADDPSASRNYLFAIDE